MGKKVSLFPDFMLNKPNHKRLAIFWGLLPHSVADKWKILEYICCPYFLKFSCNIISNSDLNENLQMQGTVS